MRLSRIDLRGFGCLRGFDTELASGLNVFYGMNEAGKSTLQQAVRAMLYGFYVADRARADESAKHERFRPWDGGVYRGALEYEMQDGRRYEVRRDFTTADVPTQLIDLFTGEDVSHQYGRGRHGNIPFARRHLGMSRGVFESCAFISQGEIFHVAENGPKEIADAIAALADTAGRDVSATKGIERLKTALSRVGSDRARTAELPKARDELAEAEAELKAIDESRQELSVNAAKLDALQSEMCDLSGGIKEARTAFARARGHELAARLQKLERAQELLREADEAQAQLLPAAQFPADLRDDVLSLKVRLEQATDGLRAAREALESAQSAITDADRLDYETLRVAGSMSGEQVSSLEATAYGNVRAWPVRAALAVGRAVGRAARVVSRLIRRVPPEVAEDVRVAPVGVSREEAVALLEKHRRYLALAPKIERLTELRRNAAVAETTEDAVRSRLESLLESADVNCGGGVESAVDEFSERCTLRARYERAVADAAEAEKSIDLLLNNRSREGLEEELERCEARIAESAGSEQPVSQGNAKSRDLALHVNELQEARGELELRIERLREEVRVTMSGHRSRAEVEEEAAIAQARVADLERTREALGMALAAIEEAMVSVYRDFAPAVNTFLSDGVEQVTEGRYTRAHVDPKTLEISLLVPETGMVVQDPPVSHGTRTLAYVLMRIGLAQHMRSVGEPVPLVLDDPFVDVDEERLPRILEYLAGLSGQMQILIFTKDREIADWLELRTAGGRHRVHTLSQAVHVTA